MTLLVSQSLGSFSPPTCASKSLSQLGASHGSLPTTVFCRAGRINWLLSESWGIKLAFLALSLRWPTWEAARLGAALARAAMRSFDPTHQTVPRFWELVGLRSPTGRPPKEPWGSWKHSHCYPLRSLEKSSLMLWISWGLPVTSSHELRLLLPSSDHKYKGIISCLLCLPR